MNRRDFLKAGAAGAAAMTLPAFGAYAAGADQKPIRAGLIGTGWYGKCDLFRLIQVAPVEVVSLCDVDKKMVSECADMVSQRQVSKKKPRTYGDFRKMLGEKDLDVVLIATPDHWHPLIMIAACEAGADLYCQKPISVDVAEGRAMVAAARRHGRVVQVGTQRRSTPHLVEARDKVVKAGLLGNVGLVEIYCYYHMRARRNPPDTKPPENLDYEMWTGPAPMRPYNELVHPRGWRAFMEYGNGIIGDMAIHMLDTARWMLELGWPKNVASSGGILVQKDSKANISDTQSATFNFEVPTAPGGLLPVVWTHRTWGPSPDPKYPWGLTIYGEKGTLKASVNSYDFFEQGKEEPSLHGDALFEYDKYPEDRTEKDLERHVASAIRWHMNDLLKARETRGKPVADIEQGYISSASCILANMSMALGGRALAFDPAKGQVVGDPEATKLLRRQYRAPWKHPAADMATT
jgi:predicted dehydrogenase